MGAMKRFADKLRTTARRWMLKPAAFLDRVSGGRITPGAITWTGFVMHIPIAVLIASGRYYWLAAILLVVFGLFDLLDGAVARVQQMTSEQGMLLDASTDRFKEVLLYTGAAFALANGDHPAAATWAAAGAGASVCVSYVKAKGEAAVASWGGQIDHTKLNRMFSDGLMPFEVRMGLLIAGLLFNQLVIALILITIGAAYTAMWRLITISKALQ
jgi:CDP-diacylglycerol--glycerol-3-phosphate 3-phosphatidyltransferase